MRFLLLILSFLYTPIVFSQDLESLMQQMENAEAQGEVLPLFDLASQVLLHYPEDRMVLEALAYHDLCTDYLYSVNLSEDLYDKALVSVKKWSSEEPELYLEALKTVAYAQMLGGNFQKSKAYYLEFIDAATALGDAKWLFWANHGYGAYFEFLGAMDPALRYHKTALKYVNDAGLKKGLDHVEVLRSLARISEIQHRYDEAEALYKQAYSLSLDTLDEDDGIHIYLVNDYAMLFFFTRQYKRALPYFEKNLEIVRKYNLDITDYTTVLANLADCYAHLGRYAEAEKLYLEAEEIERTAFGESYNNYATTISRIGDLYAFQGRFEEAKAMHLKAVDLVVKYFPPQDLYLFYALEQAYLFFIKSEDWEMVRKISIDCFERNCTDEIPATGTLANIQALAEHQTFATMPYALKSLNAASLGYWEGYLASKDRAYLEDAYRIQLAIKQLLNRLKNAFATELDKLELLSTTQQISELGIKISNELYVQTKDPKYQQSAFMFLENNKYVLLQDALQARSAQSFGDVPPEIVQEEQDLDQALLMAKTTKIQATDTESKKAAFEAYNQVVGQVNDFKLKLEQDYPSYYNYKYTSENPTIEAIQTQLPKGRALLEYFIGKESIHLYTFTHDQVDYINLDISNKEIQEKVKKLRKELSDYSYITSNTNVANDTFQALSYWFYTVLVEPSLSKLSDVEELIIVPDGLLGHLPFEAFVTSPPVQHLDFSMLNYLLRQYKISYAYSASFTLPSSSTTSKDKDGILAMGASYNAVNEKYEFPESRPRKLQSLRTSLKPLAAVTEEVKALETMFGGAYYYGKEANEQNFKKEASNYAVLHLAMHGILNEKHPILSSLAFTENGSEAEDNFLQAYEISQLKLNADLVVLSACETGYGKFQQGEGVMSLARSFMYAGVPAMVVSMWQVNDASTSLIMQRFYQNLAKGMDKPTALQQAKLMYIDHTNGTAAHPAFWAPFIQLGNTDPVNISSKSGSNTGWWFGGALIFGLGLLLVFKRKKK